MTLAATGKSQLGRTKRSTGRDERALDKEDLDSGEQIVGNPWKDKMMIRGSVMDRNQGPSRLSGRRHTRTRIEQWRTFPADEGLRSDGLNRETRRATGLRFAGIVRGMLTRSGIQIFDIAATRDNSSLHHAHGEESKCQSVEPGAHLSVVLPGKGHVPCHFQAYDPVAVSH
jgi:hypothetical protein